MASSLLSELTFGSYLAYSPRGQSEISKQSRRIRDGVKAGHEVLLRQIVERLARDLSASSLAAILGPDVTLVPAPRSSVLVEGGLWPTRALSEALVAARLGAAVVPALKRTTAVPKSAFQAPGQRPTAMRHYETILAEPFLLTTPRVAIVDDFVTKGNTLLGAASRLAEALPSTPIATFALIRTLGFRPEIDFLIEPCLGTIRSVGEEATRTP